MAASTARRRPITPTWSSSILARVEPSLAGPKRPQDRVPLRSAKSVYRSSLKKMAEERPQKNPTATGTAAATLRRAERFEVKDGAVLIAAITSCTNTSNPRGAGRRRTAGAQGERAAVSRPSPGSRPRSRRARAWSPITCTKAGLLEDLEALGFLYRGLRMHDLHRQLRTLEARDLRGRAGPATSIACSVLSGNRNFEGRVHPEIKMNFLASPPLVVAYALAGSLDVDITTEPLGIGPATASRCTSRICGRAPPRWPPPWRVRWIPRCSRRAMPTCSPAMPTGAASRRRRARSTHGTASRPTSRTRPTSTA